MPLKFPFYLCLKSSDVALLDLSTFGASTCPLGSLGSASRPLTEKEKHGNRFISSCLGKKQKSQGLAVAQGSYQPLSSISSSPTSSMSYISPIQESRDAHLSKAPLAPSHSPQSWGCLLGKCLIPKGQNYIWWRLRWDEQCAQGQGVIWAAGFETNPQSFSVWQLLY